MDLHRAIKGVGTVLHTEHPIVLARSKLMLDIRHIKAYTIILYFSTYVSIRVLQRHLDPIWIRMFPAVIQGFLNDPEHSHFYLIIQADFRA